MENLDARKTMDELRTELYAALKSDDTEKQEKAFINFAKGLQAELTAQAKEEMNRLGTTYNDEQILVNRGTKKALTSAEKKYFNAVIQSQTFEGIKEAFPKTIIEDVVSKLKNEHPLLSRVDMKDTDVLAKFIMAKKTKAKAFWGPICEDIKQMILEGFKVIDVKSSRLSGFVPVCKGMLELGPTWLATYVTTIISEIMAAELENAIVAGTGKEQPIGMMKKLSGATDSVYPDKPTITMADLKPMTLAGVRAAMAKAKTDSTGVCLIVNPLTYWAKVFPALVFQTVNGEWVSDRLPSGEEIIQSYAVPENKLIFGDPQNYFLGVSGDVRIDQYKETLAIEDMDLFIAKFYGFGMAKDQNAFFVGDVSTMPGATIPDLEKAVKNTGDNAGSMITSEIIPEV